MDGSVVDFEVLAGQCLDFELAGDAQSYGGVVGDYRWCVDAAESPAAEGEIAGCVPWSPTHHVPPICFDTPGIHTVSFAVRTVDPGATAARAARAPHTPRELSGSPFCRAPLTARCSTY